MNKAIVTQFYWDPDRYARETLAEYVAYELCPGVVEEALTLVDLLENTACYRIKSCLLEARQVRLAYQLAETIH